MKTLILKISPVLFPVFLVLLSVVPAFGSPLDDMKDSWKVSQKSFTEAVIDAVISGRTEELDSTIRGYPENFRSLDLPAAYRDAGLKYYKLHTKNIALKLFLKGYDIFSDLHSKQECGYYVAKILYQQNLRESALFYINRVIGKLSAGDPLRFESERLKRRIRWEYLSRSEGLPDDSICKIEFDGDDLWIGMWTGGVARFTRSGNTVRLFRQTAGGLVSRHVRDVKVVRNRVYVATYAGLCYYDKKRSAWVREQGLIGTTTVKKLKMVDGEFYAATLDQGLYRYNEKSGTWEKYFTGARNVTDVLGKNGKLYISSLDKGLFVRENGKFRNVVPNVHVKTLALLGDNLWAGTHGGGIIVLGPTDGVIRKFGEKDGMSSDYVETMEPVSNRMIIGTLGGGVSVYHPEGSFSSLTVIGGLPSNDVVRITFEKNKVWFGTLSGGVGILLTENFEDI